MDLTVATLNTGSDDFEVIERKGLGHPDTLADHLADVLSQTYAQHTLAKHGVVLHHNFDKVGLLGGRSHVEFGRGTLLEPIRVLVNGRASHQFGTDTIDVWDLLTATATRFLLTRLPKIGSAANLQFHNNLSTAASPGHVGGQALSTAAARATWFSPAGLADVRETERKTSNDTSVGCAHWPPSGTEILVLQLEEELTSTEFRSDRPWLGTDIKVMACRQDRRLDLTLCIPQIADHVTNAGEYRSNLSDIRKHVIERARQHLDPVALAVSLNTKDDFERPELYLTATGSSIESGDEGLVGRGNRPNRLIAMTKPYSMEGSCGKNPVYHVGKLYPLLAQRIARGVFESAGCRAEVWVISQEGRRLDDPWLVTVRTQRPVNDSLVKAVVDEHLAQLERLTADLVAGNLVLS